jgi:Cu(I)/Ag(I) efflux system membrane fusion protein/cobalt-zinc-cadmium efflux system membrane fusion protein
MRLIPVIIAASLFLVACGQESAPPPAETASASEAAELYTCGMHPNVVQEEPGTCPICGMDLTPVRSAAASQPASSPQSASGERKIKYWVAPMDPTYISDKPGKSPMGMDLVPVYEDNAPPESASGAVTIDPTVVQNMGARVEPARRQRPAARPSFATCGASARWRWGRIRSRS